MDARAAVLGVLCRCRVRRSRNRSRRPENDAACGNFAGNPVLSFRCDASYPENCRPLAGWIRMYQWICAAVHVWGLLDSCLLCSNERARNGCSVPQTRAILFALAVVAFGIQHFVNEKLTVRV